MRLPFPERIPFRTTFYFAALLCAVQVLEGTNGTFSLCCFFFILLAGVAFNLGGGLNRPSGAYVFFYSFLVLLVGLCWKAVLGEPADSNLLNPMLTISIYLASMAMMLVAVYLSTLVKLRRTVLRNILPEHKVQTATVGCVITGSLIALFGALLPGGNGSIGALLNQLNHFFLLAIVLGVIHTIRRTGGRRSVSLPVLLSGLVMFFQGLVGFSKEGMLSPFFCWILAAASQRYRVSRFQMGGCLLAVLFIFYYLVPYSQYGRNFNQGSASENVSVSLGLLADLGNVREQYLSTSADAYQDQLYAYFNTPQGFFDRLQMIGIDDALNDHTVRFGTFGLLPVVESIENIVPHFLWKDKPSFLFGNNFAHEVGLLAPADESTGVSFSSAVTAFHMVGWPGVFFLAPLAWFLLFTIYDSLFGDVRRAPWGLVVLVAFAHVAPEGDIASLVYMCTTGAFSLTVGCILAAYVMPILGSFFIGPENVFLKRTAQVRAIPRRVLPTRSSEA